MSTKKNKIDVKRNEDLQDIDTELDAALENLDTAVQNIGRLLETIEQGGTPGHFAELPDEGEEAEAPADAPAEATEQPS